MQNPLISVIIPVYNVEPYLRRCLDSVVNQTYRNLEIILVDDGSPDHSPKICDEYAENDSRIIVIHKENEGQAEARNKGIDAATGAYITFVDADDYISSSYVNDLYKSIEFFSVKFAICQMDCFTEYRDISQLNSPAGCCKISKKQALEHYCALGEKKSTPFLAACCKLYHRSLFEELRFPIGCIYEDSLLNYKLIDLVDYIAYVKKPLYHYLMRNDSTMGQRKKHDYKIVLRPYKEAISYFKEKQQIDLAALFYPPLLMREVYRYWIAKDVNKNAVESNEIFELLKKDYDLFRKSKGNFGVKIVFLILVKCPSLYSLYRKMFPGLIGGR